MPDVAVYLKADYPDGKRPTDKVPQIPPRLAVEVLSRDNTPQEIDKKLREFFASGCRLAYVIDPRARTARRHTSPDEFTTLDDKADLDGGDVLPGFAVNLAGILDED
jgi:Uma2 family endonuclease